MTDNGLKFGLMIHGSLNLKTSKVYISSKLQELTPSLLNNVSEYSFVNLKVNKIVFCSLFFINLFMLAIPCCPIAWTVSTCLALFQTSAPPDWISFRCW